MKTILYSIFLPITFFLLFPACEKDGTEKRCDKGYTGKDCDQEITPARVQVISIECLTLPPFDNGSNWDPLGGKPDLYFRLVEESSGNIVYTSPIETNADPTLSWSVNLSSDNILFNSPGARYSIQAWDHDDLDADDFMGGITFTPYVKGEKFPESKHFACSGCNTEWRLNLDYLF